MKILDVGCGEGNIIEELKIKPEEYTGITYREEEIKKLKEKGYTAIKMWLPKKLPFKDNNFDIIIAYHVIEHFTTPELRKLMKELKRVLKQKGEIRIKTPTPYHPWWRGEWTHEKVYDHSSLPEMLTDTGFKVKKWEYPQLKWLPNWWQKMLRFPLFPLKIIFWKEIECKATKED